jgi:integrase
MAMYQPALGGSIVAPIEIGASRSVVGTIGALIGVYLAPPLHHLFKALRRSAPDATSLKTSVKRTGKRVLRAEQNGKRVMLLTREHMQRIVNEKSSTPFAQRNFLNTMRAMFRWAMAEGRVPDDPTLGVKGVKAKTSGYKTWSEADIERFEARHLLGSKARLAFALLLYTGQRRNDVTKMGRQHVYKGVLTVDQRKTEGQDEAHLEIPIHPELQRVIDSTPSGHLSLLVTSFGKPYTSNGFGNWFRELCDAAGCPGLSAHGLREGAARRLAEIGCSTHEIAAITGHASLAEVGRAIHQSVQSQAPRAISDDKAWIVNTDWQTLLSGLPLLVISVDFINLS